MSMPENQQSGNILSDELFHEAVVPPTVQQSPTTQQPQQSPTTQQPQQPPTTQQPQQPPTVQQPTEPVEPTVTPPVAPQATETPQAHNPAYFPQGFPWVNTATPNNMHNNLTSPGDSVNSAANLSAADIDAVATAVATKLLNGGSFGSLADDMGVPEEFRLGRATQNYLVWSSRMGAKWALQEPETLLFMAVIFDAMSAAGDPASRIAAAQIALNDLKRSLHG